MTNTVNKDNYPVDNPLIAYKLQHPKETWKSMSAKCGLTVQGLIKIAQRSGEELKKTPNGTFVLLKDKFGIDLAENIKY